MSQSALDTTPANNSTPITANKKPLQATVPTQEHEQKDRPRRSQFHPSPIHTNGIKSRTERNPNKNAPLESLIMSLLSLSTLEGIKYADNQNSRDRKRQKEKE